MVGNVGRDERAGQGGLVVKMTGDAGVMGVVGHKSSILRQEFMDAM
jgi:hypothetical protein